MTTEQCGQDQLPIGLFDSGVGGLTVLDAMRRLMPGEDYLFLGDTARVPYGAKSQKTIVRYSLQAAAKLIGQRIKLLVIACNTATAAALPALRETWPDMPIIGVIEPGSRAACEASPSGDIAVIATESTIRSGAYAEAILRRRPEAQVRSLACPLFVPLAEEGWFDGPIAEGVVSRYLEPLFEKSPAPDCLVLGCTIPCSPPPSARSSDRKSISWIPRRPRPRWSSAASPTKGWPTRRPGARGASVFSSPTTHSGSPARAACSST